MLLFLSENDSGLKNVVSHENLFTTSDSLRTQLLRPLQTKLITLTLLVNFSEGSGTIGCVYQIFLKNIFQLAKSKNTNIQN